MFARIHTLLSGISLTAYVFAGVVGGPSNGWPLPGLGRPGHVAPGGASTTDCNTGTLQCCEDVQDSSTDIWKTIIGLLGGDADNISGLVGLNCNPITAFAAGGSPNCNQQPVCCKGTSMNGLIPFGCNALNGNI